MKSRGLVLCLWVLLALGGPLQLRAQAPVSDGQPPSDIRLVVDISGSMKRTDPENLRRPALSLLVRLLPPDSRAGVWTFGESVNMLVPHGRADAPWKAGALERVDDINSVALFTHIGAALEAAAYDRDWLKEKGRRADIILLTDGVVDVSPDAGVSAREQQRVVNTLIPELRAAGYRVHTIGLSDEADEALLRQIARASDGLFSRARNAEDLMDSLLLIFQQSVPADQLPINDGFFLVDESVEEFTALVRRDSDQAPTVLIDPQNREHRHPPTLSKMNWHHTEAYDLITVTDPMPGRWKISAELQPFSRLTVISDLKLVVEPQPNNVYVGEPLPLRFHLRDDNGIIDEAEVLDLLTVTADIRGPEGEVVAQRSGPATAPVDGVYELTLSAPERPGEYDLTILLDGKTFKRLYTHQLMVATQFEVDLSKRHEQDQVIWTLVVDGKESVNPEQTSVVAHVRHSEGGSSVETLEPRSRGVWALELNPEKRGHYRISLKASGRTQEGKRFEEHLPSQYFSYPEADDPEPDPVGEAIESLEGELETQREETERARSGEATEAPVSETTLSSPEEAEEEPAQARPDTPKPAAGEPAHPAVLIGSLVFANGLLLVLAYVAYRAIVGERKTPVLEEADEEGTEPEPGETPLMQAIETEEEPKEPAQGEAAPDSGTPSKDESEPTSAPPPKDEAAPESGDSFDLENEDPLFPLPDEDDDEPRQ
ncbi:vWA domain-containing protein [Marinimicrobium locisalis]|uniref:vWA domain-containing protein n=1 Tax=Marinimicrobium locisalis TaxID=546022 RepID=UPI003221B472